MEIAFKRMIQTLDDCKDMDVETKASLLYEGVVGLNIFNSIDKLSQKGRLGLYNEISLMIKKELKEYPDKDLIKKIMKNFIDAISDMCEYLNKENNDGSND